MKTWILGAAALIAAAPALAADRNSPEGKELLDIYRTIVEMHTAEGHAMVPKEAEFPASKFREAGFAADDIKMVPVGETTGRLVGLPGKEVGGTKSGREWGRYGEE